MFNFKPSNALYYLCIFLLISLLTYWSTLRGIDDIDTQIYLGWYNSLINNDFVGIASCQAFEPIFCVFSFLFSNFFNSALLTHTFWAFLFFSSIAYSFLLISRHNHSIPNNFVIPFLSFLFISINYIDPQIVFFLTRQYVAAGFIMIGIARLYIRKNPILFFFASFLIHFSSIPFLFVFYLFNNNWKFKLDLKNILLFITLIYLFYQLTTSYFFEVYFESILYKFDEYSNKSDGDVTLAQELKLLIYWSISVLFFKKIHSGLYRSFIGIYIFYLLTFVNELAHLRYFKYLESLSWFSFIYLCDYSKNFKHEFVIASLSFRFYKYSTLISPESGVLYMAQILLLSLISILI